MGSIQDYQPPALTDPSLIAKLTSSLKTSQLLTPNSEGYAQRIKRWSDVAEKPAGAVLLATSAADISTAVLFATTWSLDLAVYGGGHSSTGASSSDGGLVIDLSRMRQVTVNPAAMTITAQGGCIWADVDEAAGAYGLATVGGTVNHTGVGGLTLGGGYGWLSGQYGLTIDNLLAVKMVLADGSFVTASETENPDLFWAIRGAGQSFGVAVEFTFRAYEQKDPVWAGQLAFLPDKLEALIEATNQCHAVNTGNSGIIMGFATPPPMFKPVAIAAVFYNGPASAAEEFFAPILSLGPIMNMTGPMPYTSLNGILNPATTHGGRKCSKGSVFTSPLRPAFFKSIFDELVAFQERVPSIQAVVLFEFLSPQKICAVPHDAMAFANRGEYSNVMIGPKWKDPKDDAVCWAWATEIADKFKHEMEKMKEEGTRLGIEGVGQYGNYDSVKEKAKGEAIFGSNWSRLCQLKRRYDPQNRFNKSYVRP